MLIFDIEANGLLDSCDRMWCAVTYDTHTGESKVFSDYTEQKIDGSSEDFLDYLKDSPDICGHNIIQYDLPVLEKLFGFTYEGVVVDTLILSKLLHFTRYQPKGVSSRHSLAAWGVRTGISKPSQEQWEVWEESMLHRCKEDVRINSEVYDRLLKEIEGQPGINKAIKVEHKVAKISYEQAKNGWLLDLNKVDENIKYLDKEIERLRSALEPMIPLKCVPKDPACTWSECNNIMGNPWKKVPRTRFDHLQRPIKPTRKPYVPKILKDGRYDKWTALWLGVPQEEAWKSRMVVGPFSRIEFKSVKLSQHSLVKEYLLKLGWEPTQWTFKRDRNKKVLRDDNNKPIKNSPKITEDSFNSIPGDFGEKFARWATLVHRRNTLENPKDDTKGWKNVMRSDGRVSCVADTLGAATGRMTHKGLVNVPGIRSVFGKEMRQCFVAPEGKVLIGADAAGAQLRLLAGAMEDQEYLDTIVSGVEEDEETGKFIGTDVHTQNGIAAGLISQSDVDWLRSHSSDDADYGVVHDRFVGDRGKSKNFIYGLLFGAGNDKMGILVNGGTKEGKRLKESFLEGFPKLKNLLEQLQEEYELNKGIHKEGFIKGLDGRRVYVDSPHKLLNYLLQGAEAIYMKYVMVYADKLLSKNKVEAKLLVFMHDELNYEVSPDNVEKAKKILSYSFEKIGDTLPVGCKMASDPKIGKDWYEIH